MMVKCEIYYNEELKNYTLKTQIDGVESIKKNPIRFKLNDSTARFRKEQLKNAIFSSRK